MIGIKTNLEPFIDWFSYTFRFNSKYCFEHFVKLMGIYNPDIINGGIIEIDHINFIDRQEYLKIEFTASFFIGKTAKENIIQIEQWLDWFHKIPDLPRMFEKSTISRVDLACNDYVNNLMSNKFFIHTQRKQEVHRYYKSNNILSGITLGKRGKNFLWFKIYEKRFDTKEAKAKAIKRFGTYNFLRMEYEIGRKVLREKNIGFKELKEDSQDLWDYFNSVKVVTFTNNPSKHKKVFHKIVRQTEDKSALIKQVIGIVRNNLMNEREQVVARINDL